MSAYVYVGMLENVKGGVTLCRSRNVRKCVYSRMFVHLLVNTYMPRACVSEDMSKMRIYSYHLAALQLIVWTTILWICAP